MKHIILCSIAVVGLIVGCQSGKIATPTNKPITVATQPGVEDSADGTGRAAERDRFSEVYGVAVDNAGNVYVADTGNSAIRKVTPQGMVTTLAGSAGEGSVDGTGSTARFRLPCGVALDRVGNLYVADCFNHTIRKVMPMGTNWVVTTLAGNASIVDTNGSPVGGHADGTGSAARFGFEAQMAFCPTGPYGVAVDRAGNVYVADTRNGIRKVTPMGVVTTLAMCNAAEHVCPSAVAVDRAGNLYVADANNNAILKVTPVGTNWVVTTLAGSSR